MAKLKLTEKAVARLKAPTTSGKQELFWDSELTGFGLLVSGVSTSKTYIAQRQLPNGLRRRVTVASAAELPLEKAREAAAELLLSMRQGRDPKVSRRATSTLRQTLDAYLAEQKNRGRAALRPTAARSPATSPHGSICR